MSDVIDNGGTGPGGFGAVVETDLMAILTGNAGGAVQAIPDAAAFGGRVRCQIGKYATGTATPGTGTTIRFARVPVGAVMLFALICTDTTLGTTTLTVKDAFGNAMGAAFTLTATDRSTLIPLLTAVHGGLLARGAELDEATATAKSNPLFLDLVAVTGVAALSAFTNIKFLTFYQEPG